MTRFNAGNWYGCLLNKLGFYYSDLFLKFGMPDKVIYDSSIAKSNDVKFRYQNISHLTTNPLIDIFASINLSELDYTEKLGWGIKSFV